MRGRDARRDCRQDAGATTLKAENYTSKLRAKSQELEARSCSYVTLRFISRF